MKQMMILVSLYFFQYNTYAQHNHVFSGGELHNHGIVDLSLGHFVSWSTDRSSKPGYVSVAEHANLAGFSDVVNINGYVKKYGNSSFIFPVGNGKKLRTLEISSPIIPSETYAVAWIDGDPSESLDPTEPFSGKHSTNAVFGSIKEVSKIGQWDWQVGASDNLGFGTTGDGSGLTIVLSTPDLRQFAEIDELRVVGWNGFHWVDLSGEATATGNTEDSKISGTMIVGITAIGIGKISNNYINNEEEGSFLLYPNPVTNYDHINMRYKANAAGAGHLVIYDAGGKRVSQKMVQYKQGINLLPIEIKNISNGTYYINLFGINGEKIITGKRFIKQ